jgi:hypothetical protein
VALDGDNSYELWFSTNFRLSRKTFRKLVDLIRQFHPPKKSRGRKGRPLEFKVMVALAYFSSQGEMRFPASLMGCSKAEVSRSVSFVASILSSLARRKISFSSIPREELERIAEGFEYISVFPNVVGAIDGCLVKVQRPLDYEGWYCRKGFTAMNMQAICDHNMKILSYSIMSGCHNDKLLWSHSKVGQKCSSNSSSVIPSGYHLIGDSGYTLYPWLLTPFLDDSDPVKRRYNYKLSSTRMKIENCFGLLKNRWRILKSELSMKSMHGNVQIVESCIFLHNFCITEGDDVQIDDVRDISDKEEIEISESLLKNVACTKRENIALLFT